MEQWRTDQAELTIHAPIRGQVTTRIAELGENFGVGAPLFSIVDLDDVWFTFNLREDLLGGLKVGDEFTVTVPAMQNAEIPLRVTVINAQGQFATWRATRATGDFDLRTFEVRAEPITPRDGLRPGMSGIASWDRRGGRQALRGAGARSGPASRWCSDASCAGCGAGRSCCSSRPSCRCF